MKESLKNEQIVLAEVRLVGQNGEQLGLMPSDKALEIAQEQNLDLVLIAPEAKPPVCKIMDYGKYRFDELKRLKDQRKNQKVVKVKEMRLSMIINDHDLEFKAKQVCPTMRISRNGWKATWNKWTKHFYVFSTY